MPDKWWKARERQFASLFRDCKRNPLSGGASRHTTGDIIQSTLYGELKSRSGGIAAITLFEKTRKQASLEGKTPVVGLVQKNKPGIYLVIHSDDLLTVLTQLGAVDCTQFERNCTQNESRAGDED